MRSVSEMPQPSYKTMRIIDGKLCSIIKRNVLITGAAGLLGPQHATALIEKNFNVILFDKNLESLKKVKKKLKSKYPKAKIIISSTDITKEKKNKKIKKLFTKKKDNY